MKISTEEICKEVAVAAFPEDDDGIVPALKALFEEIDEYSYSSVLQRTQGPIDAEP
jgi:hypothetical protein